MIYLGVFEMKLRRRSTALLAIGVVAFSAAPAQASATSLIAEPTVTSAEYPDDGAWHPGAGMPGSFTFNANGDDAVIGFYYGNTDPAGTYVAADHPGGTATVSYIPQTSGPNDLYVASVDSAGNRSPQHVHHFYVQSTEPQITGPRETGVGVPAEFRFAPRIADVVSYTYRIDDGPETTVAASADGATTANIVTASKGLHRLYVWSTTGAGLTSGTADRIYTASDAPLVASTDYPDSQGSGGPGVAGVFTLTPRMPGVVEYTYYLDEEWSKPTVVPAAADGTASFTFTPAASGFHSLKVFSRAADGTRSDGSRDYYVVVN
ncbi:hypothetical protein NQK81_13095 [Amycolatopsis roodepoortensis]|uniref:hypothetical protein n=1 Tax=Amycolatopsis roodepoortensis TaxID=700274 RepID=UPI00214AE425|nr:hypothetical protein [Amycolatopsis roodepoortensis]UUV34342.1 hypothetical protein NQK81_13095 [Amycolatopsis roodepoortensis]